MRDLLANADLARYAGQFVWLELNYDKEENRAFFTKYGANATPAFFIISSQDEQVIAAQTGAMSLLELTQFFERGATAVPAMSQTPVEEALRRADALLAAHPADAAESYEEALRLAPAKWPRRDLAKASLVQALQGSRQWRQCSQRATTEATHMKRDVLFARTVVAGMWCLASADPEPWSDAELGKLQPLAEEALSLSTTVRDHRDSIYRTLMYIAVARNNDVEARQWGDRWLAELDAIKPTSDDERSALDIARVENLQIYGDPMRILPALIASERAMPNNYIASLRLAQMELAAKHYDDTIAASDRGLVHVTGPLGQAWLMQIKAEALLQSGKRADARRVLEDALRAAGEIALEGARRHNIEKISKMLNGI